MKRFENLKGVIFFALTVLVAFLIAACDVEPRKSVPEKYKVGQKRFHQICANCHGPDAMGGNKAPNLIQEKFTPKNFSNGKIAKTILNGSSSGAMPSQKGKVSDKEIKEIIKYLRYSQRTYNDAS